MVEPRKRPNEEENAENLDELDAGLKKRRQAYLKFIKTRTGKECEAFRERLVVCIEDYRKAKTAVDENEASKKFYAVFAEIDKLPAKKHEIIREHLRGYGGRFADLIADKHGMRWHRSVLKRIPAMRSAQLHFSAPNKKFGNPLFDEGILKENAEKISEQAFRVVESYLVSKYPNLAAEVDKKKEQVKLVFVLNGDEAVKEFIRPYGEETPSYIRNYAANTFIIESCPATYDEETNRIIFNLGEISKGRTQTEAEIYLLQTAVHEYLHPLGGLEQKTRDLRWMNEGIIERMSHDICASKNMKLDWTQSGYAPYMSALKWLSDLGVENSIQETAYFTRNPQLLMDEMKKIGMTSSEIERLLEYGTRIDLTDALQTDMYVFIEYVKRIRRRIRNEPDDSQNLTNQLADAGLIYKKCDLSSINSEDELQNYLRDTFLEATEEQIESIREAIFFSQKTHGNEAITPLNMAERVQDRLLEYKDDFQAKPDFDVFLELFLQREILWINNLRFGKKIDTNTFEIINADKVLGKIGINLDMRNSVRLAARALGYLSWKNIHEPSIGQVVEVILKCKEQVGPNNQTWEEIGAKIDNEGIAFASKTRDELYEIYKNKSSDANLLEYLAGIDYPTNKSVADGIRGLFGLAQKIVYPGDWLLIHPELGIVRTDIEGDILPQYSFSIGGSYDLMMYTEAQFSKILPLVDKELI